MLELLVVMTIMAAIVGIGIPVYNYVKRKAEVDGTRAMLDQVTLAMQGYGMDFWTDASTKTVYKPGGVLRPMWDVLTNAGSDSKWGVTESALNTVAGGAYVASGVTYGFLDASTDTGANSGSLAGYRGILVMSGISIPQRFINSSSQVVDAWGRRILVAPRQALPEGVRFGLLSAGPSLTDTTDDIKTW